MNTYLARQPIFNREQEVVAYELLYRSSMENRCLCTDFDRASREALAESLLMPGALNLANGKRAFLNVTREVLLQELVDLFPAEAVAVELLETVAVDEDVLRACRRLKAKGYLLVLDDYVDRAEMRPMLEMADIVKVDFMATTGAERKRLAAEFLPRGIAMLAEKVETQADFEEARALGYAYFQGYFFARPQILTRTEPTSSRLAFLNLVEEVQRAELDYHRIETLIKNEPTLSYKLLRYVNTAAFGRSSEVTSIMFALNMLGEMLIRKWATVIAFVGLAGREQEELVRTAIVRAHLCAAIAAASGLAKKESEAYFLGLFSVIDALFKMPMAQVLSEVPLPAAVKDALLGKPNNLRQILNYVLAYEQGSFAQIAVSSLAPALGDGLALACYQTAIGETDRFFQNQSH